MSPKFLTWTREVSYLDEGNVANKVVLFRIKKPDFLMQLILVYVLTFFLNSFLQRVIN